MKTCAIIQRLAGRPLFAGQTKGNMNRILHLLALGLLLIVVVSINGYAQCSGERWPVKTGTDIDAFQVNLSSATSTSIANLTALSKPKKLPDDSRIKPTETTTWVLNATIVKYVRSYDADYHIVFKDSAGRTMIGEIPDPNCVPVRSPFRPAIVHARAQFDAMFTPTTNFQDANVPVQITGVGFFDYNEGQEGIAPNAIELHPIIDIVFGSSFSLSSSSSSLNIPLGGMGSTTVTSTIVGSFNSVVSLSASGFPAGTSVNFAPASFAAPGSGSSAMTVSVGPATPAGTYNIVVDGSGGGQNRSVAINLVVAGGGQQLLGNPGFENGRTNPSPWSVSPGVIDNSSQQQPHSGSWKAWLNGYGAVHTDNLSQAVTIPSGATSAAFSFWRHIDTAETSTTNAYDTVKVQIQDISGSVLATLATYSNLDAAAGYSQSSFDLLPYKGQSIQISVVGVEDASLKTSFVFDDFALNTAAAAGSPNFAISTVPPALTLTAGSSGTSTVTTSISDGFDSSISLVTTGLPAGAAASFSPTSIAAPGTGSAVLTISTAASIPSGTYPFVVSGTGGGLTRSSSMTLTVNSSGGTQQLLLNGGFENGSANPTPWTVTPAVINNSSVQAPHSGSWKAWLNGYGAVHTDTLYQQVTIPNSATNATLSLWRHIDTAEATTTTAYDTLKLQIRNSSGTVLATLATYSNLNAAAGYTQSSFDLLPYKGQAIQVYLIGVEDSSLKTSFIVDDFLLNVTIP